MSIQQDLIERFEDLAYRQYEASRTSIVLGRRATDELIPREQFLRKNKDGGYEEPRCAVMFIGWKLCMDTMAEDVFPAAVNWGRWCALKDRAAVELPDGYEIVWSIEREDPAEPTTSLLGFELVHHLDDYSEMIEFDDPEDVTSPGLEFRLFEAALDAAKEHAESLS